MEITERQVQMLDPRGFDKLFEQERLDFESDTACFKALNEEYKAAFGRKRYKNFKSYHSSRFQRIS